MNVNNIPYGKLRDIANELKNIREILEKQSTDTPQTEIEGEWIEDDDGDKKCSNCGEYAPLSFDDYYMRGGKIRQEESLLLCPYCGAKMKGAEE